MNITMKIMPPLLEENTGYAKSRSILSIKEECKKVTLFRIKVYNLPEDESKAIIHRIRQNLYRPSGYIGLQLLSEEKWGQPAEYDNEKQIYEDCIIIPRDFDNPEEQRKAILECIAKNIYEIKMQYNGYIGKYKKKTA